MNKNKQSYDYYKSRGICVRCKKNKAKEGRVQCTECLASRSEYSSRRHAQGKATYDKKRKSEYIKRKKQLCDAFGVCTTCMNHDKYKGKECINCYLKRRRKYKEKTQEANVMPRELRREYNLCQVCGEPTVEGTRLCKKHLVIARCNIAKASKCVDYTNHKWRRDKEADIKILNSRRTLKNSCTY